MTCVGVCGCSVMYRQIVQTLSWVCLCVCVWWWYVCMLYGVFLYVCSLGVVRCRLPQILSDMLLRSQWSRLSKQRPQQNLPRVWRQLNSDVVVKLFIAFCLTTVATAMRKPLNTMYSIQLNVFRVFSTIISTVTRKQCRSTSNTSVLHRTLTSLLHYIALSLPNSTSGDNIGPAWLNSSDGIVKNVQCCTCIKLSLYRLRRLHQDLIYSYKIIFGLIDIDCSRFFTVTPNETTRGHV